MHGGTKDVLVTLVCVYMVKSEIKFLEISGLQDAVLDPLKR